MSVFKTCSARAPGVAAGLACLLLLASCTDLITVTSQPPGAKVYIDGVYRGETPLVTHVKWWAWRQNPLKVEKRGYETFDGNLKKGWRWDYIATDAQLIVVFFAGLFVAPFNIRGPEILQHIELPKK